MSKALITGGAGFIASHVADAYLELDYGVVIVDDLSTGRRENLNDQAKFYQTSILDPDFAKIVADEKPDVINHHAAQVSVRLSVADPVADATTNIIGTLRVLEAARDCGVKKAIFSSTGGAIYGEQDYFPADEHHPTRPVSPYGIAKLSSEHYLRFFGLSYGLNTTVLRYANVYGPRQDPHGEAGVVAIFAKKMLSGEQPVINGDGTQTRDFVYVGDVAAANVAALSLEENAVINVGTGIETSVNQLFTGMCDVGGFSLEQVHGPAMPGEQLRSVVDNGLAEKLLDWKPVIGLQEGLRQTIDFFRG